MSTTTSASTAGYCRVCKVGPGEECIDLAARKGEPRRPLPGRRYHLGRAEGAGTLAAAEAVAE